MILDTLFLAQLMGCYLIIEGIMLITRQSFVRSVISDLMRTPALRLVSGLMALVIGLVLVLTQKSWSWSPEGVITLLSWAILFKSIVYLLFPEERVLRIAQMFNKKSWYILTGIIAILLGLYLANTGFAWGLF